MSEAATQEALGELRERLRATAAAAERLVDEAATGGPDVPRRGDDAAHELQALVSLIGLLRDLLPDELREQLAQVVRQLLLAVRAVIDWWVLRLEEGERPMPASEPMEDIPVE